MSGRRPSFRMEWRTSQGVARRALSGRRSGAVILVGGWVDAETRRSEMATMDALQRWWSADAEGVADYLERIAQRDLGPKFLWISRPEQQLRADWDKLLSVGDERKHRRAAVNRVNRHRTLDENALIKSRSAGQAVLWEFFHEPMLSARSSKFPSFYQAWAAPNHRRRLFRQILKFNHPSFAFQSLIRMFSITFYQPANFSPGVAADLIDHVWPFTADLGPRLRVLDPCSGFGGRLLGFLASNRGHLYVGVDPNTKLGPCYRKMIQQVRRWDRRPHAQAKQVKLISACAESVDWVAESGEPEASFDLLLTSPPYFNTEIYSTESTQSSAKHPTLRKWIEGFLYPMLVNAIRMVRVGGVILLNIKNNKRWDLDVTSMMTQFIVRSCGCAHVRTIGLELYKRIGAGHSDDASKANTEPIFAFVKTTHAKLKPVLPAPMAAPMAATPAVARAQPHASPRVVEATGERPSLKSVRRVERYEDEAEEKKTANAGKGRSDVVRVVGNRFLDRDGENLGEHLVRVPNGSVRHARFPLRIQRSPIHGLGVFTDSPIAKGQRIVKWQDGRPMTWHEVKERYTGADGKIDWRYVYMTRPYQLQIVNKRWSERNVNNYVNDGVHGQKNPVQNVRHTRKWLVATRDIKAGEELLGNFGQAYWASNNHG